MAAFISDPILLISAKEQIKTIGKGKKKIAAFAGLDKEGLEMGVGLLYPANKARFWGLSPKDIVASYRGMKIAEQIKSFPGDEVEHILCCCWYAGSREEREPRYTDVIDQIIGEEKRQDILNAPLTCLDNAIEIIQERGIDFFPDPLVREIKEGRLQPTPALEKALQTWADSNLLYRGLSEKYRLIFRSLSPAESPRFDDFGAIKEYVAKAEAMFAYLLPALNQKYCELREGVKSAEQIICILDRISLRSSPLRHYSEGLQGLNPIQERLKTEMEKLERNIGHLSGPIKNEQYLENKFLAYAAGLKKINDGLSYLEWSFRTLLDDSQRYAHKKKEISVSQPEFAALRTLACDIIRLLNRAVQQYMPGMYNDPRQALIK